jgi:Putative peptidoglycan binding domain/L,D-transpeptidase catalytic domain
MKIGGLGRATGLALGAATAAASIALAMAPASSAAAARSAAPTGTAVSRMTSVPATARTLKEGMSGSDVLALQHRLWGLHYWPAPKIDGRFTHDTTEAVWAFQAINGLTVDGVVGPATAKALAHPRAYKAQYPHGPATRVEVNINKNVQVLVLFKSNAPYLISHVSSGGGYSYCSKGSCGHLAITPTGTYTLHSFIRGWVTVPLGKMYNPVFFIGTSYAIHGDTSVPVYPASHGCIRIPNNLANTFHTLITVSYSHGTQVDVYNRGGVQHV